MSGGSILPIRKDVIAVKIASKQPGAGGAGMRASIIGPARRAKSGGVRKVGATANADDSKQPHWKLTPTLQLEPPHSARASAQHKILRILSGGLAAGRVVTRCSPFGRVRRVSISVRALAVRRYDACWTARRTGGGGIGGRSRGVGGHHIPHRTAPEVVSPY